MRARGVIEASFIYSSWLAVFMLVFVFHFLVCLFLHNWSIDIGRAGFTPFVLGGDDGEFYYDVALQIASDSTFATQVMHIWPIVLGRVMAMTGIQDILFFKLLNVSVALCIILLALRVLTTLTDSLDVRQVPAQAKLVLILLFGAYPSMIFYTSSSLYRDVWIYLFYLLSLLFGVRTLLQRRWASAVLCCLSLSLLFLWRWYAAVSSVLGFMLWLVCGSHRGHRSLRWQARVLLMVAFVGGGLLALVQANFFERIELLLLYREGYAQLEAGSNLGINFAASSPALWPFLYLYSFVTNVWGPLPFQVHNAAAAAIFVLEVPLMILITYRIWQQRTLFDAGTYLLLWQACMWFVFISFSNDNIGTATRLRVLGWHSLFILYAYLLVKQQQAPPRLIA